MKVPLLLLLIILAAVANSHALELHSNSVESAERFGGATWAEKINTAVIALPMAGGVVDAAGLCSGRAFAVADTNVVLGNDRKPIRLNLGPCTYRLGTHRILYFPNTEVGGMGINASGNTGTTITYVGSGAGFAYGGSLYGAGVYGVFLHDFSITGDGTPGSIGIDMTYALVSTLERINTNGSDNGWRFGGSATCACYNQIIRVVAFDRSRGGWLSRTANQNQIFGGAVRANNATGIGLDIENSGSNQIYSLDIESSAKDSITLGHGVIGNSVLNPYIEAAGPILIERGAQYNSIVGTGGLFERGSVVDYSGNLTNYVHQTGGGGGTDGVWPYYEVVQDGIYFGLSPYNSSKLLSDGGDVRSALELRWSGGIVGPQYGLSGHAPLEAGEGIFHSGANVAGLMTTAMIANPAAPAVSPTGTTGKTPYSYYLVCHDRNGGVTEPSPAGSTSTGNATLNPSNYNQISWKPVDGCWLWDLLKGNTHTALATFQQPSLSGLKHSTITLKDIGQPTSPYRLTVRNTSGDLKLAGMMVSAGLRWPLPESVVNGGSFYCPNCDPPMNPSTDCTSSASRTGSWVHGLNNHWICVP
jgi:hypothetical protein